MSDVLIVMPAHNESSTIEDLISDLVNSGYPDVLVVDDCSTDRTAVVARQAGAKVISLPYNMGAWKATQTGIRYALKFEYDLVVTMDSDGQHLSKEIKNLILAKDKGYDLVIGSCTERGSKSRVLAWKMFKAISRLKINDLTSGFRAYGRNSMHILSGRKATLLEYQDLGVLFLIQHLGLKYIEIPVEMRGRQSGISRIFSSWFAVFNYMLYSLILTAAKTIPFGKSFKNKLMQEGGLD